MNTSHFLRQLMLPLKQINLAIPEDGLVYEIGCGMGVISTYLAQMSERQVVGIDLTLAKLKRDKNFIPNVSFIKADAITYSYKQHKGAVLSDFLHHLDFEAQKKLLENVSTHMSKKGVLVIKEIDKADGWRRWASRVWDLLFYPHDFIYYRTKSEWLKLLSELGYLVRVQREVPWFPGSTFLFVATKK